MDLDQNSQELDCNNKLEPEELWEECWFFGNLLDTNWRVFRSLSDPCTTSEIFYEKSYEEVYESINKRTGDSNSMGIGKCRDFETNGSDHEGQKSHKKLASSAKFFRAPSLQISLGIEDFEDEEIEFSMGKLIRQASMDSPGTLATRTLASKSLILNRSISQQQSRKESKLETEESSGLDEMRTHQLLMNQVKTRRSSIELESIDFKKDDLQEKYTTSPYLSAHDKWGSKKLTEDMKEQIKFWARAVASNVH